jgi:hypothetical protein
MIKSGIEYDGYVGDRVGLTNLEPDTFPMVRVSVKGSRSKAKGSRRTAHGTRKKIFLPNPRLNSLCSNSANYLTGQSMTEKDGS